MEFGYTIPLQRHLKIKLPPPQTASAPFFCWDVHLLTIQKRRTALAMNRASRYCILLYGMDTADWKRLPELVQGEIRAVILREGLSEFEATRYFALSGPLSISQSLGAESTAALNWAMRTLLQHASLLDERRLSQPQAAHIMNHETYHAKTLSKRGSPKEFFLMSFRCL